MDKYIDFGLSYTPELIEREVRRFSPSSYDSKPDPKRFSMREVVAHLSDWEPIFLDRMKACVETPGSVLIVYDEGQRALDNDYAHKDPNSELAKWKTARQETISYLKKRDSEQFKLRVMHPERGEMSLADLANMLLGHDIYHLEQLDRMLSEKTVDVW